MFPGAKLMVLVETATSTLATVDSITSISQAILVLSYAVTAK